MGQLGVRRRDGAPGKPRLRPHQLRGGARRRSPAHVLPPPERDLQGGPVRRPRRCLPGRRRPVEARRTRQRLHVRGREREPGDRPVRPAHGRAAGQRQHRRLRQRCLEPQPPVRRPGGPDGRPRRADPHPHRRVGAGPRDRRGHHGARRPDRQPLRHLRGLGPAARRRQRQIGWASANQQALATEVDAQDRTVWELRAVEAPEYFTDRAYRQEVPDRIEPEATIVSPAPGAEAPVGSLASPVVECSDRGGSSLVACAADPVDTLTPGVRTVTATARDGAGNVRAARTPTPSWRRRRPRPLLPCPPRPRPTPPAPAPVPAAEDERLPDLHASSLPRGRWKGEDVHDAAAARCCAGRRTDAPPSGSGPERRLRRRPVPAPAGRAARWSRPAGGSHASYAAARAGGVVGIPPGCPPGTRPAPHRRPARGGLGRDRTARDRIWTWTSWR